MIVALLYWARVFFITSLVAVTIAFILEPFVGLLMRIRFPRSLASFVVCSIALMLLYLIGLGAYTQIAGLYDELPQFSQRIGDIVEGARHKIDALEDYDLQLVVPARQRQQQQPAPAAGRHSRRASKRNPEPRRRRPAATASRRHPRSPHPRRAQAHQRSALRAHGLALPDPADGLPSCRSWCTSC